MTKLVSGICSRDKILAIMPTRTCTAACRDCGSFSSPKVKQVLELSVVRASIAQAAQLDFKLVAFTGGEATLAWNVLLDGLALAHSLGLRTRLVTNAHWADTPQSATRVVAALRAAGLDELNISTGDEHVRFVGLDLVAKAIAAGLEHGYAVQVMIEYREHRTVTRDVLLAHELLLEHQHRERVEVVESPWMPLSPRRLGDYKQDDMVDRASVHSRGPCTSVLQSYTVHPDGRLSACCGLGVELIGELYAGEATGPTFLADAVANAESDLLKLWLRYKGPEKILAWAAERDPLIRWESSYAHNCQACHRVYHDPKVAAAILEHYEEAMGEIVESVVFDEVLYPVMRAQGETTRCM